MTRLGDNLLLIVQQFWPFVIFIADDFLLPYL
jgi:hypothetical protein